MENIQIGCESLYEVLTLRMEDNRNELPFFITRYSMFHEAKPLHRHEYMQINYVAAGKGTHMINQTQFPIMRGDIFIVPPLVVHSLSSDADKPMEMIEFEFEPTFINQNFNNIENIESFFDFAYIEPFLLAENKVKPCLNLIGQNQIEVESLLTEAILEYKQRQPGFVLMIRALLLKLLVLAGRAFTQDVRQSDQYSIFSRHHDAIFASLQYINEHSSADLKSEEIARKFNLSTSYFRFLFKSIVARTFTEYLNDIRLAKALERLKKADLKVIEICYEVGFNNINHFNRLFKHKYGMSPSSYRQQNKA